MTQIARTSIARPTKTDTVESSPASTAPTHVLLAFGLRQSSRLEEGF